MLEIRSARKVFYRGQADEKIALDGLSLSLATGEFGIVIGSNGAGKSSMLNAISGALILDTGKILINGADVTNMPVHKRAARLARVFQDPMRGTAASMTVAENMLLADLRSSKRTLRQGLNPTRLASYKERLSILGLGLENRLDTRVDLLSGGQRQSLSLIMAVGGSPDLLLLDEHTAALDPRTAEIIMQATVRAVSALKLTTLMVTHNMQHAVDYGSRVIMLDAGRVLLEVTGEEKARITVIDLIGHFSVKTDRMLLAS
ncbi:MULTISPECIES: ABC transporter ATP-binding protein [unclassified Mesorhizobium]|uniref:ABC transporter ATP-binding protein n=1 Tax=unclassified Mesorhizobium TaxID=325217 RepID=UPI000FD1FCD1|nr:MULTISPECIES: ABC transporter ATP-binding protein [unclassified Mesorhizobium]RUX00646.1 ABC transporter ATP-binding protein [Mesorhizobium sp. M8A.F.Ca.ET.059.01.1.1]RWC92070.1 MAG: ABC transporter ATP-binding protein [Mesorhizobium sp.]TGT42683.1 ABC transporter ATP-binding protein [Mesorhizobium sp. M8A.F.Ca.ET.165.01.1.1]TIT38460.1 MAG: ABC transporter ATP-binding protein [Mesorhizobium sp.]TIT47916.1 MAG: ABC transporter ATP-binding protein [Mesorhizobium sp.]